VEIGGLQPLHFVRDLIILDTTWYSGVNFTVGLKYADEKLLAGLVFKSPFTLRQKTNRTADYYEIANGNTTSGTPIKIHFDNIHARLDMPMFIGGGLGYRLKENFLVTADAEYRPFSGGNMKLRESFEIIPGEKDRETFSEHDPLWKDVFTFRTGAEYTWITGSKAFPKVPVRAGFASVPIPTVPIVMGYAYIPVPEEFYDPDLLGNQSRVTATSFSFGTGVHWTQIQLDLAYTYTKLDRNTGQEGADFKNKNSHLNFTFTGVF